MYIVVVLSSNYFPTLWQQLRYSLNKMRIFDNIDSVLFCSYKNL